MAGAPIAQSETRDYGALGQFGFFYLDVPDEEQRFVRGNFRRMPGESFEVWLAGQRPAEARRFDSLSDGRAWVEEVVNG